MRFAIAFAISAILVTGAAEARSVRVKSHITKSGTYVAPHYRTKANRTRFDNWTSRPNVNPYTGKRGTRDPLAPKRSKW